MLALDFGRVRTRSLVEEVDDADVDLRLVARHELVGIQPSSEVRHG
jgi:hypothetical protein